MCTARIFELYVTIYMAVGYTLILLLRVWTNLFFAVGGCGSMYQICIEAEEFRGKKLVEQQRMVNVVSCKMSQGLKCRTQIVPNLLHLKSASKMIVPSGRSWSFKGIRSNLLKFRQRALHSVELLKPFFCAFWCNRFWMRSAFGMSDPFLVGRTETSNSRETDHDEEWYWDYRRGGLVITGRLW